MVELNFNYIPVGLPVRAINRPGSQMLGANGRDSGSVVSLFSSIDYKIKKFVYLIFCVFF